MSAAADRRLDALDRRLLRTRAANDGLATEYQSLREWFESVRGGLFTDRVMRVVGTGGLDQLVRLLDGSAECHPNDRRTLDEVDRRALAVALGARDEMRRVLSLMEENRAELAALDQLVRRCREFLATEAAA